MARASTTTREPAATDAPRKVPSVLVVLVTSNGLPWLRECLRGLARQTHARLGVVAVDNGSTDGSRQVLEKALGSDRVLRLTRDDGLAAAVKAAAETESAQRADYLMVLHDDTALDPEAVQRLVEAAQRVDGVGVVGPKVVDWQDPGVLREVGLSTDRFGYPYTPLERDELDQGQYDRVREVLFVSSSAMLISLAAWRRVGALDERFAPFYDDLDFCWRARMAGFRVLMAPLATARHREAGVRGERAVEVSDRTKGWARRRGRRAPRPGRTRFYAERASLGAMLKNYSLISLLWILPLYAIQAFGKSVLWVLSRRFDDAVQLLAAWGWNLLHLPSTIRRRVRAQAVRSVPDRAVRRYMAPASVRLRRWVDTAGGVLGRRARERDVHMVDEQEELELPSLGARAVSLARAAPAATAWILAAALCAVAYRHLVGDGAPQGGALASIPDAPGDYFREFASGVRTTALGGAQPASPALALLGALSWVLFGGTALAVKALLFVLPPLAGLTLYRCMVRRTGARVPAVLAGACYALSALTMWSFSQGRIAVLVLLAALPALEWRLAEAFEKPARSPLRFAVEGGIVLAVAVAFLPGAAMAFALLVLLHVVVPERGRGLRGGFVFSASVAGVAALLVFPLALSLAGDAGAGLATRTGEPVFALLARLTPDGTSPGSWAVAWFLPAAALLSFTLVEPAARRAALRFLLMGAGAVYLAWGSAAGWLPEPLTNAPVYLAVGALAFCGLVALGLHGVVLMGRRSFGYGQLAGVALAALLAGGLAFQSVEAALGDWAVGPDRLPPAWPVVTTAEPGAEFRVLWLGDPGGEPFLAPGGEATGSVRSAGLSVRYAVTGRDGTTMLDTGRWAAGPGFRYVERGLAEILSGSTVHGGALLGTAGIRYVVAADGDLAAPVRGRLGEQLDLDLVPAGGLILYRNERALPRALATAEEAYVRAAGGDSLGPVGSLPSTQGRALVPSPGGFAGRAIAAPGEDPADGVVLLADQFDGGWRLEGESRGGGGAIEATPSRSFGWAVALPYPAGAGDVRAVHAGQTRRTIEVWVLAALWAAALWITRKPVRRMRHPRP